jgi:oxalate decarboxylase
VQEGGWSRQVNVETFPLSVEIAGVNMRLTAGGVRELHWRGRLTKTAFDFRMMRMTPQKQERMGEVRIVDSRNFPVSANIAMAHVTLKPGGLRELHWHPNADEWQYWISGKGRMTLFHNRSVANTADFTAGDAGYVPKTLGHYIENTGDTDLVFLEMFKAPQFQDISLNDWMTHIPPELVTQHLGISPETLATIPKANYAILPA